MTDNQWPQEVADFYQELSLGDGPKESIAQVRDAVLETRKWKRIAGGLAAVCVVLLALGAFFIINQKTEPEITDNNDTKPTVDEKRIVEQKPIVDEPQDDEPPKTNETRIADDTREVEYDVMVVYVHRDWCGKCKKMGRLFTELQHDLSGKRVLFLRFDLTNPVTTKQSQLLGDRLAINKALQGIESGKIVLLDQKGRRLETLDGLSGREFLANQIAMRL